MDGEPSDDELHRGRVNGFRLSAFTGCFHRANYQHRPDVLSAHAGCFPRASIFALASVRQNSTLATSPTKPITKQFCQTKVASCFFGSLIEVTPTIEQAGNHVRASSPPGRIKSPPCPTGLSAGASAGGTRLGEGLAKPTTTPRGGHTVARLSPATPPRLRHADGTRLSRSGGYAVVGSRPPRRCAALRS